MNRCFGRVFASHLFLLIAACDAGSITTKFIWAEGRPTFPPEVPATTFSYVQQRTDVRKPGRDVIPVLKTPFSEPKIELRVPYEKSLSIIAELRLSPDAEQVEQYGNTELFDFNRGDHLVLEIFMQPTKPPQPIPAELGPSLVIVTSTLTPVPGYVNRPDVELLLFAEESATHVRLSNVVGLPEGNSKSEVIELATLEPIEAPAGYRGYRLKHWNLDAHAEPCVDRGRCRRELFARFGDAQSYYGPAVIASVILDQVAPSLIPELTSIAPMYARGENFIAISVTATEIILEPRLLLAQRADFPFVRVSPDGDQPTATYTFTSSTTAGALAEVGTFRVRADVLQDLAGNRMRLAEVGMFTVDTVVPEISNAWVDPPQINDEVGRVLRAGFTINKVARATMLLGGRPMDRCTETGRAPQIRVTCERAMRSDEIPAGTESVENLSIDAEDDAGNIARRANLSVYLDFRDPNVFAATFTPEAAANEPAQLLIIADEPLDESFVPQLHWDGLAAPFVHDPSRDTPLERYYVARPPINTPPGEYPLISVTLRDEAGNEAIATSTSALPKSWLFDPDAPVIEDLTVTVRGGASVIPPRVPAIAGTIVDVHFIVREQNVASVRVLLGSRDITATCSTSGAAPVIAWHCTYVTTGTEYPPGVEENESVLVEVGDRSGGRRSGTVPIVWDLAPPEIQSVSISPSAANSTAQLTISVSEALAPGFEPPLTFSPPIAFVYDGARSTPFQAVFQYSVPAAPPIPSETHVLSEVRLRDVAGNESVIAGALASLLVDNVAPVIGAVTVDVGAAALGLPVTWPPKINGDPSRRIIVIFTISELNPGTGPLVLVGAIDISQSCVPSGTGSITTWTCTHWMTGSEDPGLQIIRIQAADIAENSATDTSGAVEIDLEPPRIVAGSESLQLVPSASNLLARIPGPPLPIQAMGIGTTAFAGFLFNEPLAREPVVEAVPSALSFELANRAGSAFTYQHTLAASPAAEGLNAVQITATDEAGNVGVLTLSPPLVVDSVPPSAPNTTRLVHTRVPWGSDQAGSGPHAFVEGAAGAIEPGARAVVVATDELATYEVLGTAVADAQGAIARFELDRTEDRQEVFAVVLDRSGNASPSTSGDASRASRVRGGEEIFTLGGKIPGRRSPNPHDAEMFTGLLPTLAQAQEQTILLTAADFARLATNDGQVLSVETERRFEPIFTPVDQPEPRSHAAMAYDSMRGRAVLFGGAGVDQNGNPTVLSDTWESSNGRWFSVTPLGLPPPARSGASMAYDAARGVVLLFGGVDSAGTPRQDSWTWDGQVWNEVTPAQSPGARSGAAMAYDEAHGRVILCGGTGANGNAWIWDGGAWTEEACVFNCPGPRIEAGMTSGGVVSLFGGVSGNVLRDDVRVRSTSGVGWQPQALIPIPAPPRPSGRRGMVYARDPVRNTSVLFGGTTSAVNPPAASSYLDDTWVNDVEINVPATQEQPSARAFAASAFDVRRGELIVFGGRDASGVLGDTWAWDALGWRDITPSTDAPPARRRHAMAYDPASRSIVVFGGQDFATTQISLFPDMWAWNGARWRQLTPSSLPTPRRLFAMSTSDDGLAMLGGADVNGLNLPNAFFTWDGTQWGSFSECNGPPCSPQEQNVLPDARNGHAMVFDTIRGRLVLFGGDIGSSTTQLDDRVWEWDGSPSLPINWTWRANTSGIAARRDHAMAFDEARGRTVLFGGWDSTTFPVSIYGDVWEGSGSQWTQASPTGLVPAARFSHAMTYDAARGRVVIYGGQDSTLPSVFADAWEWTGSSWVQIGTSLLPGARAEHGLAFDPDRRKSVLFGGVEGNRLAWELDADPDLRSGMRFVFDTAELGVDPALLQAIEVRAVAGGAGSTVVVPGIGNAAPGAELGLWNARLGRWMWLGSNAASASSPAIASFTVSSAADVAAYFSPGERIYVVLRTANGIGNGLSPAELSLDNLELHLRYQYPN